MHIVLDFQSVEWCATLVLDFLSVLIGVLTLFWISKEF
jgi:hypothetical protein